jgi:hypothetical protein
MDPKDWGLENLAWDGRPTPSPITSNGQQRPAGSPRRPFLPNVFVDIAVRLRHFSTRDVFVYWILARLSKMRRSAIVTPVSELFERFEIDRSGKCRALAVLEKAGLIAVTRRGHHPAFVTLLDTPEDSP